MSLTRCLHQGSDFDARSRHVDEKKRDALVLRSIRIGPSNEDAPIGELSLGVPNFLPVHDERVTVTNRTGRESGEIGPGTGFGEQLTPVHRAVEQTGKESLLLLGSSVTHDRRSHKRLHSTDEPGRDVVLCRLLTEQHGDGGAGAAPAKGLGPGDTRPSIFEEDLLPSPTTFHIRPSRFFRIIDWSSRPI